MERVRSQEPPGRFLQKIVEGGKKCDPHGIAGRWVKIEDSKALAKISQALREGAPAFRALHGKERGRPRRASRSTRARAKRKKRAKSPGQGLVPGGKPKEPPTVDERSPVPTPERAGTVPGLASTPPLLSTAAPAPSLLTDAGSPEPGAMFHDIFGTEGCQAENLLNSHPLIHMGDCTVPLSPITPRFCAPPEDGKPGTSGAPSCTQTPDPISNTVSPSFSSYGAAEAPSDAMELLPALGPEARSPTHKKPTLQRSHSLSFSDCDARSLGSFNDPFDSDGFEGEGDRKPRDQLSSAEGAPDNSSGAHAFFPPPLPAPWLGPRGSTPHGSSFGRMDSVPGGGRDRNCHHRANNKHGHGSTLCQQSSRESGHSSTSRSSSISNPRNHKRNSVT